MAEQRGFFDLDERYAALSKAGDPLSRLAKVVDFEIFRAELDAALKRSDGARGGRPPMDAVVMFKVSSSLPNAEPGVTRNLDFYMIRVARLGGYLARRNDAPPRVTVMWRGFSRLVDLIEGYTAGKGTRTTCG